MTHATKFGDFLVCLFCSSGITWEASKLSKVKQINQIFAQDLHQERDMGSIFLSINLGVSNVIHSLLAPTRALSPFWVRPLAPCQRQMPNMFDAAELSAISTTPWGTHLRRFSTQVNTSAYSPKPFVVKIVLPRANRIHSFLACIFHGSLRVRVEKNGTVFAVRVILKARRRVRIARGEER
jgi:hypothetical protein